MRSFRGFHTKTRTLLSSVSQPRAGKAQHLCYASHISYIVHSVADWPERFVTDSPTSVQEKAYNSQIYKWRIHSSPFLLTHMHRSNSGSKQGSGSGACRPRLWSVFFFSPLPCFCFQKPAAKLDEVKWTREVVAGEQMME